MHIKTSLLLLPFLFLALLQTGCEKFKKPLEIEVISRQIMDDGSVRITGAVVSGKAKHMSAAGFEVSKEGEEGHSTFEASIDGDKFTAVIHTEFLESYTKYYFMPYILIKDGGGGVAGEPISLDNIQPLYVAPPCNLTTNYVNLGSGAETYYSVTEDISFDTYTITGNTGSVRISFTFPGKPKTGVYKTIADSPSSPHDVMIMYYTQNVYYSYAIDNGASVYVHQTESGKWDINVCGATWNNGTSPFSTRMIYSI